MKNRLQEYALISEIVGGIAIVTSLIFVGVQMHQNNKLREAEARHNKLTASIEAYNLLSIHGDLAEILVKWDKQEELTEVENFRASSAQTRLLLNMEWMYREMPSDSPERRYIQVMAQEFLQNKNNTLLFNFRKPFLDEEFVKWMESFKKQ